MKIIVEFDSEDEFKARIKNPRGSKGEEAVTTQQAPAPLQPPAQQAFQPATAPAFQAPQGMPFSAPVVDPVAAGLVQRINARIDAAIAGGQPADSALNWFRGQCGAEAANATLDQIKHHFLPKMAVPTLENIAKLMAA